MKLFKRVCCHVRDKVKLRIINKTQKVTWITNLLLMGLLVTTPLSMIAEADDEIDETIVYGTLLFEGEIIGSLGAFLASGGIVNAIRALIHQQGGGVEIDPCSPQGQALANNVCRSIGREKAEVIQKACIIDKSEDWGITIHGNVDFGVGGFGVNITPPNGVDAGLKSCEVDFNRAVSIVNDNCDSGKLIREASCGN